LISIENAGRFFLSLNFYKSFVEHHLLNGNIIDFAFIYRNKINYHLQFICILRRSLWEIT